MSVRVVSADLERLPGEIDGLAAVCLRFFGPAINERRMWQIAAQDITGP